MRFSTQAASFLGGTTTAATRFCWFEREKPVCHSFVSALESCSPGAAAVAPIKQHQPSRGRDGWCCYTLGGCFIHSRCRRCFHQTRAAGRHFPYWNNACRGNWLPWGKAFLFLLKLFRHILQQRPDRQMLRADALALAAADAVRRAGAGLGVDILIIVVRIPIVVDALCVHDGE